MDLRGRLRDLTIRIAEEIKSLSTGDFVEIVDSGTYDFATGVTAGIANISHSTVNVSNTMIVYSVQRYLDNSLTTTSEAARHYILDRTTNSFRVHVSNVYLSTGSSKIRIKWKIVKV